MKNSKCGRTSGEVIGPTRDREVRREVPHRDLVETIASPYEHMTSKRGTRYAGFKREEDRDYMLGGEESRAWVRTGKGFPGEGRSENGSGNVVKKRVLGYSGPFVDKEMAGLQKKKKTPRKNSHKGRSMRSFISKRKGLPRETRLHK